MSSRTAAATTKARLVRSMGRWDLTALTINGIIGSGIFGVPSAVAKLLGVSSPIAFVVCAAIVYVFVLCFAEVASYFSETGGPYLYGQTAFGPFVGFEVGWSVWLARVSAFAANSNVLVLYLGFFVPQASRSWGRAAVLTVVTVLLALINIRGIQAGARVGNAFAVMKVGVLSLFGVTGLFFVDWSRFKGFELPDSTNFGAALLLLIYVFTGFEYAVIPAAEAKDPKKHLASALIVGLGICAAIYITVQIVALGTVPNLAESQRPLADAGRNFLGPVAGGLIALTVCVSVIGNLSAMMLIAPRLTYAFAKGGDFPALFARLHASRRTPVVSINFFCGDGVGPGDFGNLRMARDNQCDRAACVLRGDVCRNSRPAETPGLEAGIPTAVSQRLRSSGCRAVRLAGAADDAVGYCRISPGGPCRRLFVPCAAEEAGVRS